MLYHKCEFGPAPYRGECESMRNVNMESIRAIDRAVDVLNAFTRRTPELTIDQITAATGLPRATVYRILYTLERRGLIRFDEKSLTYRLGFQFLAYGNLVASSIDLRQEAEGPLLQLYERTRQSVLLAVREGDTLVYIFRKETPEGLKVASLEGLFRPLVFGAFGAVIMAYLPDDELSRLLKQPIPQFTPDTLTDPDQIRRRLAQIRRDRVFAETNEALLGVTGIAAPVFNMEGQFVAAVGVDGPSVQLCGEQLEQAKLAVMETAAAISKKLGYRSPDGIPPYL